MFLFVELKLVRAVPKRRNSAAEYGNSVDGKWKTERLLKDENSAE
jgi:hypothetical protein